MKSMMHDAYKRRRALSLIFQHNIKKLQFGGASIVPVFSVCTTTTVVIFTSHRDADSWCVGDLLVSGPMCTRLTLFFFVHQDMPLATPKNAIVGV